MSLGRFLVQFVKNHTKKKAASRFVDVMFDHVTWPILYEGKIRHSSRDFKKISKMND